MRPILQAETALSRSRANAPTPLNLNPATRRASAKFLETDAGRRGFIIRTLYAASLKKLSPEIHSAASLTSIEWCWHNMEICWSSWTTTASRVLVGTDVPESATGIAVHILGDQWISRWIWQVR
jgi:hypothetical protein